MSAIFLLLRRSARLTSAASACLLLACAHSNKLLRDKETTPAMPAPAGEIYTRALGESPDPIVANALHGLPWDEVLSGAASGVALAMIGGEKPTPYRMRWHAILAAWPYPLVGYYTARVEYGEVPKALVDDAKKRAAAGQDLGVVRARDATGDLWVLLASEHPQELGPLPRDPDSGSQLNLLGADFLLTDPLGNACSKGEGSFRVEQPGVWLVEARTPHGDHIATFPMFVDGKPPQVPPIEQEVRGKNDAAALAVLDDVRAWYNLPSLVEDPSLDSVARARLHSLTAGESLPSPEKSLRAAGFVDVPVAGAECKARTVAECLDILWWTPERRSIFSANLNTVGVAVQSDDKGVTIVLVAAG